MTAIERLAIALIVGIFGFLTGLCAWWYLSDVPGLDLGWSFYLTLMWLLGIVCFLIGLWRPEKTVDVLGLIGRAIYGLWNQVFHWFRFLR